MCVLPFLLVRKYFIFKYCFMPNYYEKDKPFQRYMYFYSHEITSSNIKHKEAPMFVKPDGRFELMLPVIGVHPFDVERIIFHKIYKTYFRKYKGLRGLSLRANCMPVWESHPQTYTHDFNKKILEKKKATRIIQYYITEESVEITGPVDKKHGNREKGFYFEIPLTSPFTDGDENDITDPWGMKNLNKVVYEIDDHIQFIAKTLFKNRKDYKLKKLKKAAYTFYDKMVDDHDRNPNLLTGFYFLLISIFGKNYII